MIAIVNMSVLPSEIKKLKLSPKFLYIPGELPAVRRWWCRKIDVTGAPSFLASVRRAIGESANLGDLFSAEQ